MKSLEIVDGLLWEIQQKYYLVDLNQDKEKVEKELVEINRQFVQLELVKQDLEVLDKYRKIFKILKDKNIKPFYRCNRDGAREYYLGTKGWCCIITKEEYELLQELDNLESNN